MKEATGELNLLLVVVTIVGALVAFFYFSVWPMIRANQQAHTNCSKAVCNSDTFDENGMVECSLPDGTTINCKYKG